jgi:DNA-binding CsgD family transcriptional regulator
MKDERFVKFVDMESLGYQRTTIMRKLGISERTYYRYLEQLRNECKEPSLFAGYFTRVLSGYDNKDILAECLGICKKTLIKRERESFSSCISNIMYRGGCGINKISEMLHTSPMQVNTLIKLDTTLSDAEKIIDDIIELYSNHLDVPQVKRKHNILKKIKRDLQDAKL